MRVFNDHLTHLHAPNAPGGIAEQHDVATQTFDCEVFVNGADHSAFGLGDNGVKRVIGNRATASDRGQAAASPAASHETAGEIVGGRADDLHVGEVSDPDAAGVRDPHHKNAPRTIDIDLSLFNHDVLEFAGHRVPDPEIEKRGFVAVPLAEIDPDYLHPIEQRRLAEIAAALASQSALRLRPDVRLR